MLRRVTRSLIDAGAEFVVLGAAFGELTADQTVSLVERTADALGSDGEPTPPITSRRSWPPAAV